MSCECEDKTILKIMQGAKNREVYIKVEGLDWDFLNPPLGFTYDFDLSVDGPVANFTLLSLPIVSSDTVKFTVEAYEVNNPFYEPGMYALKLMCQKWTDPPDPDPHTQHVLDVDACIFIYEEALCPPPC